MEIIERALGWLGYGLCHQLPERSFFGGGIQAPVCARDTGIFLGFTIALLLIWLLHRPTRPSGFPALPVWLLMAIMLAFLGWDGVTSYAGVRETTNWIRLASGLGVGFSVAAIVAPMLNGELWADSSDERVLAHAWRVVVWLVALPLSFLAVGVLGPHGGVVFPLVIAVAILITFTAVNLVIVSLISPFNRRARRWADLVTPAAIALAMTFAELALATQLRLFLERLAASAS